MQEIVIEFKGQDTFNLHGNILQFRSTLRNKIWNFQLLNIADNKEIIIPNSSNKFKNGTITIKTDNIEFTPTFWTINEAESESNIYTLITYPNSMDLLLRRVQ